MLTSSMSSEFRCIVTQYDGDDGYAVLQGLLTGREAKYAAHPAGRLFYLALPPSVYPQVRVLLPNQFLV